MSFIKLDLSKEAPEIYRAARKLADVSLDDVRLDHERLAELRRELLDPYLTEKQMDALVQLPQHEVVVLTGFDLSSFTLPPTPKNDASLPELPKEIPLIFLALTTPSGLVVTQNHKELIGTTLQHVYPEEGREKDHSSRGLYDLSEHTDEPIFPYPARLTGLDCIYGDPKAATGVIALSSILDKLDAETIRMLGEPVYLFESGKTYIKKHEFFQDSILKEDEAHPSGHQIKFHNNSRTTTQSEEGAKAMARLKEVIAELRAEDKTFEHTQMPGDKWFGTNVHGLHYRKPLTGAEVGDVPLGQPRWNLRLRANTQQYEIAKDATEVAGEFVAGLHEQHKPGAGKAKG